MKIACFGASVTQQYKGYSFFLGKHLNQNISVHGFGSEHIVYGGIVHIDKVLESKPSLCFIDWFSTGWIMTNEKTIHALDTIKYKFSKNNCKMIFLFLPRKDHDQRIPFV